MMTRFYPPLVLSLALLLTVAPTVIAQPVILRPYDALLEDTRLTDLVDAQSRRDAAFIEQMLGNEDAVVRARAALAAGSVQAESSLRPLIALLSDRNTAVRADAAFALGQLRDSTAARPLFDALSREDDARTRFHLHQALGETSGSVVARTFLAYDPERGEAWSYALALARIGLRGIRTDEVARRLLTFAGHPDAEARRHAAYFFWRVNNPDAWASIEPNLRAAFQRLDADDPAVGYLALALSARADVRDVHATGHLLENSASWQTRDRAARALGRHAATSPAFDMLLKGAR
jgi:HEAT repeat protein